MRARIPVILAVLAVLAVAGLAPAAASAASGASPSGAGAGGWQPEPASYGVSQPVDIPVRMDDGVVISTEVVYPTDPSTGARAGGTFPVLLSQNPYGTAGELAIDREVVLAADEVVIHPGDVGFRNVDIRERLPTDAGAAFAHSSPPCGCDRGGFTSG